MDNLKTDISSGAPKIQSAKGTLIAGLVAGLAASTCCAGPLVLLMLGISGSWIGNLRLLEPYRPFFMLIALTFIALAFRKIYLSPKACRTNTICATPQGAQTQKLLFWITTVIIILSIAFPWYSPLLFD